MSIRPSCLKWQVLYWIEFHLSVIDARDASSFAATDAAFFEAISFESSWFGPGFGAVVGAFGTVTISILMNVMLPSRAPMKRPNILAV